ncbi:multidrug resistance efflux pump [Novosphingobium sp. Rr 2-17]|uniref:HlyD family secretion protein n=1 Tax=Novosphingobium sp. Rr 2-17 TaxID=555793 RepID=UPI0002697E49|nr:HlyD family secretion protein [Novosphingobium sp. Rr 2-17]EIZ80740.1 multidrug resistance efflux pump [Novosphingobium sp. Rr 2-17]
MTDEASEGEHFDRDRHEDATHGGEGEKKPSPLSRPGARIALIAAGVAALGGGVFWLIQHETYGRYQQSTDDAYLDADQVDIAPRISGYVEQVFVGSNQDVRKGQVLARVQSKDYDAQAGQAQAQIAQGQASIEQAKAQIEQQYATIAQSEAELAKAQATVGQTQASQRLAAIQVARYGPLAAAGGESHEQADQYKSQLAQADAQLAQTRNAVRSSAAQLLYAKRQIAVLQAQIKTGEAQVQNGQAQLAAAMVNVHGAVLRSSTDGRIGDKRVRVGQYVQAGTRLMTVVPVGAMYLTANFKETQIGLMRIGQPVHIEVDALPGEDIHGTVVSFAPGTGNRFALVPTDNATGNFTKIVQRVPVRIRVDAGPEARKILVPGLSATVSVDTRGAKDDRQTASVETTTSGKSNEQASNTKPAGSDRG